MATSSAEDENLRRGVCTNRLSCAGFAGSLQQFDAWLIPRGLMEPAMHRATLVTLKQPALPKSKRIKVAELVTSL